MNETGRKTFFWYRAYCGLLIFLYLAVTIFGIVLAVVQPDSPKYDKEELFIVGTIYAVVGLVLLIIFTIGILLPPKPYNWIVGIVLIGIGMTSCCFLPICVPLLIYWLKPETKSFFGRS